MLTPRVQARVRPYSTQAAVDTLLQELTAADVHDLSQQHAFTWVVTWAPWCEPWKQYAEHFKAYQQQLADRDINLVFVDIAYSPATAMGANASLRGNRPAYVINWRHYGNDADVKFRQELIGIAPLPKRMRYVTHLILNRQQQVILKSTEPDLPFELIRQATTPGTAKR